MQNEWFLGYFIMLKQRLLERFSQDQLDDAVRKKQDQFAGLLTDEAALRVLAHESGFALPPNEAVFAPLSTAQAGQLTSACVRVFAVYASKRFENAERSGRLCKIRVADSTASADLVLWNSDVGLVASIGRNDVLLLKDVLCRQQSPLELHSRLSSEITVVDESAFPSAASLPKATVVQCRLSELSEGTEADVVARIVEKTPMRQFQRQNKTGFLSKLKISDGSATLFAACWDENAHAAQALVVGDAVKIEGAVLKNGEISVSWFGRLILNPKNHALAQVQATPSKSLAALDASDALVEVRVERVFDAQRQYKCRSCGAKSAEKKDACTCGSKDFSSLVYASLEVSDSSGIMRAVLFDQAVLDLLGAKNGSDLNLLAQLKRDYLVGKTVRLLACAKQNARSGQKEILGKEVLGWKN